MTATCKNTRTTLHETIQAGVEPKRKSNEKRTREVNVNCYTENQHSQSLSSKGVTTKDGGTLCCPKSSAGDQLLVPVRYDTVACLPLYVCDFDLSCCLLLSILLTAWPGLSSALRTAESPCICTSTVLLQPLCASTCRCGLSAPEICLAFAVQYSLRKSNDLMLPVAAWVLHVRLIQNALSKVG